MGRCKKLITKMVSEADQYGIVLDILTNDDVSSDSEIVDLLADETKFDVAKLKKLISSERGNFLKDKYKKMDQGIKAIKKYI